MSTATTALNSVKRRVCELTDTRFDRRYRSLTGLQQLVTMGLAVGAVVVLAPRLAEAGLVASLSIPAIPLALFALLTTLFARYNRR